jgi:glucosamine--fructose-6-phosphate aminotransferase (isomerizing)
MCGVVACHMRRPAPEYLLPALRRLEYRGYDSAGVAINSADDGVLRVRSVGRVAALEERVAAHSCGELTGVGIGHTRWATHGVVSESNAHPHVDCRGDVHVVHNGIIENAEDLRTELTLHGHRFETVVDSETVAHLVEDELAAGVDLVDAVQKAVARMTGSWALAVLCRAQQMVVVTAHRSPLVVAHTQTGAYAASDMTALVDWAETVQVLEDGDFAELRDSGISWRRADGSDTAPPSLSLDLSSMDVDLGDAPDFMAKEIAEQQHTIAGVVDRLSDGIADGSLWKNLGGHAWSRSAARGPRSRTAPTRRPRCRGDRSRRSSPCNISHAKSPSN